MNEKPIEESIIAKKSNHSLFHSTTLVSCMTLLSRVFGFIRDMTLALVFGAGAGMDAFFVAFKIPNFLRRLFAEGAFSQAFVPILSEYQSCQPFKDTRVFIARVMGGLLMALTVTTLLAICFAPLLVAVFAPGFYQDVDTERYQLASHMLRITFPYLLFISLTAFQAAILNTYGYYGVPSFTPVLLNIVIVVFALIVSPHFSVPVEALAWAVLVAGLVQFLFQIPFLWKHHLLVYPVVNWHDKGVKRVLWGMGPAIFGVSVAQVNLLVDTIFASFLIPGSVSWLYYSDRLMEFPLGVIGVAFSTVILPHLSRTYAKQTPEAFSHVVAWAIKGVLAIGIPSFLALYLLGEPILITLFHYGQFTIQDVHMTEKSLQAFAFGIPAFMLIKVLASAYYAQQDFKTPVKIGIYAMVLNIILNCILVKPLQHAGLALSTSIAAYFNAGCLWWLLRKRPMYHPGKWWKYFVLLAVVNIVFLIPLIFGSTYTNHWFEYTTYKRMESLFIIVAVCGLTYLLMSYLVGLRLKDLKGPRLEPMDK